VVVESYGWAKSPLPPWQPFPGSRSFLHFFFLFFHTHIRTCQFFLAADPPLVSIDASFSQECWSVDLPSFVVSLPCCFPLPPSVWFLDRSAAHLLVAASRQFLGLFCFLTCRPLSLLRRATMVWDGVAHLFSLASAAVAGRALFLLRQIAFSYFF